MARLHRPKAGFWIRFCVAIIYPVDGLLFRIRFRHLDRMPAPGRGVIIAVNHLSQIDTVLMARLVWQTGRIPRFMIKAGVFGWPIVGPIMTGAGQIPVHRGTTDAAHSLRDAAAALERGEAVVIYPEGTTTKDPTNWPMQGKTGVGRLVLLSPETPVVPVGQWGPHKLGPSLRRVGRRRTAQALVGEPLDLSRYRDRESTPELQREVTDVIMRAVREQVAQLREETRPSTSSSRSARTSTGGEAARRAHPSRARRSPSSTTAFITSTDAHGVTSSTPLSRRTILTGGALGVAAVALPVRWFDEAAAAEPAKHGVFGYGVASGDPTADAVVIWTRATPPGHPVATPGSGHGRPLEVHWEVARDRQFRHVVRHGKVWTHPSSDHTVKIDVDGLTTYTTYWYRFRAHGETSPVGATRTAPADPRRVHALRFALVSCSNYTGGYFGPYRGLAERDDLDFILHVGDYIYEYGDGADRYGPTALVGKRDSQPTTETIDLAGYRLRHALHKADPDLQQAHRVHPFIAIFDDHEVANNTWNTGAENHTPGVEGDFFTRRTQAYQAYMEWMPFRLPEQHHVPHQGTRFFRRFDFGPLADLSVLETRQNRSRQVDVAGFTTTGGGFIPTGTAAVDAQLADPSRHLPEPEQLRWLQDGVREHKRWHLIGNQVVFTPVRFPGATLGAPADLTLLNSDQWDGYQADQAQLIAHLAAAPRRSGDAVVLTGDIHSSWAMDIPAERTAAGYTPAGVEFVCPSVTSDGFYENFGKAVPAGTPPATVVATVEAAAAGVKATNPWIKYLDGVGHGYTIVDVTPERVQADFYLTPVPTTAQPDPRVVKSVVPGYRTSWQTVAGSRHVTAAKHRIGRRADEPRS